MIKKYLFLASCFTLLANVGCAPAPYSDEYVKEKPRGVDIAGRWRFSELYSYPTTVLRDNKDVSVFLKRDLVIKLDGSYRIVDKNKLNLPSNNSEKMVGQWRFSKWDNPDEGWWGVNLSGFGDVMIRKIKHKYFLHYIIGDADEGHAVVLERGE